MNYLQKKELEEMAEMYDSLELASGSVDFESGKVAEDTRFKVTNVDQLNWALRKMKVVTDIMDEKKKLHQAEMERLDSWFKDEAKKGEDDLQYFRVLIEEYVKTRKESDEKYKGDSTPYGKVGLSKQAPEWKYANESEITEFLQGNEALKEHVVTQSSIANKTALKSALEIKRNVFVKDGLVVDVAQEVEQGYDGMQYTLRVMEIPGEGDAEPYNEVQIVDIETGELVFDVELRSIVAVAEGKVVPGIELQEKPERVTVKII